MQEKREWLRQGGEISENFIVLKDYDSPAGVTKGHYFHQDLLVAQMIYESKPERHLDISSRLDGFVAHVASFREIEVVDIRIRSLEKSCHKNIKFIRADLMRPLEIKKTDSLSCLHAIEHFGLGRYGDQMDINGHFKGITNLVSLIKSKGVLYISFPIGKKDEVHFNAHRVFHPKTILKNQSIKENMELLRFDYVDDNGDLHLQKSIDSAIGKLKYGCGIYTFKKK
tara:strand:+ start:1061 stop:1738 length:678 start_codon:yes stop_codon:yes gene_type:complete